MANWEDISTSSRDVMKALGNFGPTVHASAREVYRDIRAGTFPAPLKRGAQSVWVASEVQAVIEREIGELPRMRTQGARAA